MSRGKTLVYALVALGAVALIVLPVYAHCGKCAGSCKDMLKVMDEGKVTLASAIAAAETQSKGKAMAAMAAMEGGKVDIEVYCLVGDKLMEVHVDGKTGKASDKMSEAKMLPGEDHEHHDAAKEKKEEKGPGKGN